MCLGRIHVVHLKDFLLGFRRILLCPWVETCFPTNSEGINALLVLCSWTTLRVRQSGTTQVVHPTLECRPKHLQLQVAPGGLHFKGPLCFAPWRKHTVPRRSTGQPDPDPIPWHRVTENWTSPEANPWTHPSLLPTPTSGNGFSPSGFFRC